MKLIRAISLSFIITAQFSNCSITSAEEINKDDYKNKPGMELVKIGDAKVVVPKGSKVYKEGDVIKVEDIGEYSGRKFQEFEYKLNQTQSKLEEISIELKLLKDSVKALLKKLNEDGKPQETTTQKP